MALAVIGQQMSVSDLPPLTCADKTVQPHALTTALFVGTLVKELAQDTKVVDLEERPEEQAEL